MEPAANDAIGAKARVAVFGPFLPAPANFKLRTHIEFAYVELSSARLVVVWWTDALGAVARCQSDRGYRTALQEPQVTRCHQSMLRGDRHWEH
jgi:hypothetical protein